MSVSVSEWQKHLHDGSKIDCLGVQFPSFGFMLSLAEVEELCKKLRQLESGGACPSEENDFLFVDFDCVTREEPFVILGPHPESRGLSWYCDIPQRHAQQLYSKLVECLGNRPTNL